MSNHIPQAFTMDMEALPTPFEMLLRVISHLDAEHLDPFQSAVPFLLGGCWVSGKSDSVSRHRQDAPEDLSTLVQDLVHQLESKGISSPIHILAFMLADWEIEGAELIERTLNLLEERYPDARIEAEWLSGEESHSIELVLVAGTDRPNRPIPA
jgi:hypothetical protein